MLGTLFETMEDRSLARLRQVLAGRHREWPVTARQVELLRRMEEHRGAARIVGREELCRALRCTRRELSADVQELRLLGVLIGASRESGEGGYFLIVTEQELADTIRPYLHQALTELRIVRELDRAGFDNRFGQLRLALSQDATPNTQEAA